MGQKLDKLSEKDEDSTDNSDWSEQTGETPGTDGRRQRPGQFWDSSERRLWNLLHWACSGVNCQSRTYHNNRPPNWAANRRPRSPGAPSQHAGATGGGSRDSQGASEDSKEESVCPESRQKSQRANYRHSERKAVVVCLGTAAMEEQSFEGGKRILWSGERRHLGFDKRRQHGCSK
ncbi:hypothetical protein WMY93_020606 [Mugilogobius chulae]|uniref:Uncharacterized protein n=1 Tax=Mugilogobius chulae TaxID=88201 RepID=A0AAW0NCK4_9GOBI